MEFRIKGDEALGRVERVLDYLARRQEALAANVANASTPGYRTVDVQFESVLDDAVENIRLRRTSPRHFEVLVPEPGLQVSETEGLPSGLDGNNVQVDRELLQMSLNRMRFQMAVQAASSRIQVLKSAIAEGRG